MFIGIPTLDDQCLDINVSYTMHRPTSEPKSLNIVYIISQCYLLSTI